MTHSDQRTITYTPRLFPSPQPTPRLFPSPQPQANPAEMDPNADFDAAEVGASNPDGPHSPAEALSGPEQAYEAPYPLPEPQRASEGLTGPLNRDLATAVGGEQTPGMLSRRVRVSIGTCARVRLLAAVLGCPTQRALIHAVATFVASPTPKLIEFRRFREHELPGSFPSHITVELPADTWTAVDELARSHGVATSTILDNAMAPYLARLSAVVAVVSDRER